jgi:hypothetical protein
VDKLLTLDPSQRPSCTEALNHPYFTLETPFASSKEQLPSIDGDWHEFEGKQRKKDPNYRGGDIIAMDIDEPRLQPNLSSSATGDDFPPQYSIEAVMPGSQRVILPTPKDTYVPIVSLNENFLIIDKRFKVKILFFNDNLLIFGMNQFDIQNAIDDVKLCLGRIKRFGPDLEPDRVMTGCQRFAYPLAQEFCGLIIGKKGETRISIESRFNVYLRFCDEYVLLYAISPQSIENAIEEIKSMVGRARHYPNEQTITFPIPSSRVILFNFRRDYLSDHWEARVNMLQLNTMYISLFLNVYLFFMVDSGTGPDIERIVSIKGILKSCEECKEHMLEIIGGKRHRINGEDLIPYRKSDVESRDKYRENEWDRYDNNSRSRESTCSKRKSSSPIPENTKRGFQFEKSRSPRNKNDRGSVNDKSEYSQSNSDNIKLDIVDGDDLRIERRKYRDNRRSRSISIEDSSDRGISSTSYSKHIPNIENGNHKSTTESKTNPTFVTEVIPQYIDTSRTKKYPTQRNYSYDSKSSWPGSISGQVEESKDKSSVMLPIYHTYTHPRK